MRCLYRTLDNCEAHNSDNHLVVNFAVKGKCVVGPSLTHQTRYDPARVSSPIVEDG
ncbi:hypothetical protein FRX31_027118, partial [Thalictrum thalictroides]